ncbi:hypothetical protein PAXRUDRAFT_54068, partial [Paxillus rubicundulus Ve08.2h10]
DDIESEDEDPIGDATPAPPSPPPRTPIPVPNPTQQRQGHRRGAQKPLAAPQPANACSTCVDFGILCEPNPGYSCFTCWSRKKKCEQSGTTRGRSASHACQPMRSQVPSEAPAPRSRHPSRATSSKRAISISAQPSANPQDQPNVASTSMGIKLCIPPPRTRSPNRVKPTHRQSAPPTSAVKAPNNMGLMPGAAYSLSRNPLLSHEEHRAAMLRLETMEVENRELCGLITQALDRIEVLEQGMASLATATMYSGPQVLSADDAPIPAPLMDDPPILAPASPAMSIPPVEVLAQTESASDNGGSG